MAVSHLQCAEYLFEKIVSVADPGLDARFYFDRTAGLTGKVRGQLPLEMYPVNGPGIRIIRTVGMRNSGWQDKILVGCDRIFLVAAWDTRNGPIRLPLYNK